MLVLTFGVARHLDDLRRIGTTSVRLAGLPRSPIVEEPNDLTTRDGAVARARLRPVVFSVQVFPRVVFEPGPGISKLLRAQVNEPVFADVDVTSSGATSPVVRFTVGKIFAKPGERA